MWRLKRATTPIRYDPIIELYSFDSFPQLSEANSMLAVFADFVLYFVVYKGCENPEVVTVDGMLDMAACYCFRNPMFLFFPRVLHRLKLFQGNRN